MSEILKAHASHTVLVVDDDANMRRVISDLLETDGLRVTKARSGDEALEAVSRDAPCLVVADVMMPGMDGLALCRRLRADPRTAQTPVVLVSGRISRDEIEAGIAAGAVDYVRKPFDQDEMRFRIRAQIREHEAELARRETENLLEIISRAAKDAIVILDHAGRVVHWNEAAEAMFGYRREEALGADLHALVAPERFRTAHEAAFPRFARTGEGAAVDLTLELVARRRTGEEFPVELSLAATKNREKWCAVGFVRDITRRKRLEIELSHARKLEAVGALAAGIAHEINTPIQYVGDNARFFKDAFNALRDYSEALEALVAADASSQLRARHDVDYLKTEIPAAIAQTLDGVERVSSIVSAMKEFSHPGSKEREPFDVNRAIRSTVTVARNEWKYVSVVDLDLGSDLPLVLGYQNEFCQAVLNVLVNAAHAIAERGAGGKPGRIKIATRLEDGYIAIRISDNGAGIPDEIRDRIFDPFFTTKEVGRGTGQGLTVVHAAIVGKHRGRIEVVSEIGAGTTFALRIPVAAIEAPGEERGEA